MITLTHTKSEKDILFDHSKVCHCSFQRKWRWLIIKINDDQNLKISEK